MNPKEAPLGLADIFSVSGSFLNSDCGITPAVESVKALAAGLAELHNQGRKLYVVCGGGPAARAFRDIAQAVGDPTDFEKDLLGIDVTHINARILQIALEKLKVSVKYHEKPMSQTICGMPNLVVVTGGERPGHTTDWVAVSAASILQVPAVFNLTNTDGIHPIVSGEIQKNVIIPEITVNDYLNLLPPELRRHQPGLNTPFDPEAARLARELNITIYILNGQNSGNYINCVLGREFTGTILRPN